MKSHSKLQRALDAATDVFTRYGFARTTMGDIASQAQMSRPALYLLFPDKETIFEAVILAMDQAKLTAIRAELAAMDDLGAKLVHACQSWGTHGLELAAVHPDAADLFDLRFAAVRQVYANFRTLIVELIADQARASRIDATPDDIARTLAYGMRGLRETSCDVADMRRLIAVHVACVARAIGIPDRD
jgi:AcrR family transcriptional regulator